VSRAIASTRRLAEVFADEPLNATRRVLEEVVGEGDVVAVSGTTLGDPE
jgi:hypothetical protein